jgi:predicted aconitase
VGQGLISLDAADQALLDGARGPGMALAMSLVLRAAHIMGARQLVPVTFAHIDACFYSGQAHIDFARFMLDHGARFAVPSWTNNGVVSLTHAEFYDDNPDTEMVEGGRTLMLLYEQLGCTPVWTCAPYQLPNQPKKGDHIVVGESNAVSYYNSVVGARTNKYGDYLDVACALVGKAPLAGLHTDAGRKAELVFDLSAIPERWKHEDVFFHLLGHHVGRVSGRRIPAILGLDQTITSDNMKAVSAAVASSGGVELWHGIGVTPDAPTLEAVASDVPLEAVTRDDLRAALHQLTTGSDGALNLVAMGTPHFSVTEFQQVMSVLQGRKVKPGVDLVITTSRFVMQYLTQKRWLAELEAAGVTVVGDICSYYSPGLRQAKGRAMTNAAKWAYYAPGMLPVEVCFGSLRECVESAVRGHVWRDPDLWAGLA